MHYKANWHNSFFKKLLELPAIAFLLLAVLLQGCLGERIPDGQILVANDTRDREYNVIVVSGGGAYASLAPEQTILLPKGTTRFSVSRRYKDYTRSYSVSCPPITGRGIRVRTIDIHVNRIAGGCTTTNASR